MHIHACRIITTHNKDERHSLLEKYTSHFIEGVVSERELETEQNCNILTPHSIGRNRVSFPFSWAAQPGTWGPASLGHVLIPAPSLQLVWSPNWLIGGLRTPSAGCWLSQPHLVSNWSDLQTSLSYIIVQRPLSSCGRHNFALIQPVHGQGYNSDIPRLDAPVIYTG